MKTLIKILSLIVIVIGITPLFSNELVYWSETLPEYPILALLIAIAVTFIMCWAIYSSLIELDILHKPIGGKFHNDDEVENLSALLLIKKVIQRSPTTSSAEIKFDEVSINGENIGDWSVIVKKNK